MQGESIDDGAASVLATEPGVSAAEADSLDSGSVIGVTYGHDAETWLKQWGEGRDQVVVVSVGERSRGAAATTPDAEPFNATPGIVETVPDEGDVGTAGQLVHDYLVAWSDSEPVVYLDDLAGVLDAVEAETAFRFVHAIVACAESEGARVVASFDRDAYPPHIVNTFAELFEVVQE